MPPVQLAARGRGCITAGRPGEGAFQAAFYGFIEGCFESLVAHCASGHTVAAWLTVRLDAPVAGAFLHTQDFLFAVLAELIF